MKANILMLVGLLVMQPISLAIANTSDYDYGVATCMSGDEWKVHRTGCKHSESGKLVSWKDFPAYNSNNLDGKDWYVEKVEVNWTADNSITVVVYYRFADKQELKY